MLNEKTKLKIERHIFPKCITTDDQGVKHFDKYQFAYLIIREVMCMPPSCIESGKDQLIETCLVDRIHREVEKEFGIKF